MQIYEKLERIVVMFTGGIKSTALLDFVAKNKGEEDELICLHVTEEGKKTHENLQKICDFYGVDLIIDKRYDPLNENYMSMERLSYSMWFVSALDMALRQTDKKINVVFGADCGLEKIADGGTLQFPIFPKTLELIQAFRLFTDFAEPTFKGVRQFTPLLNGLPLRQQYDRLSNEVKQLVEQIIDDSGSESEQILLEDLRR